MQVTREREKNFGLNDLCFSQIRFGQLELRQLTGYFGDDRGPVVSWWIPASDELNELLRMAEALHGERPGRAHIVDVGAGHGVIASILASSGRLKISAVEPGPTDLHTASRFLGNLSLYPCDIRRAGDFSELKDCDLALCSWMHYGSDLSDSIAALRPRAICIVSDLSGSTGNGVVRSPIKGYRPVKEWTGPSLFDICAAFEKGPGQKGNGNLVCIYLRQDISAGTLRDGAFTPCLFDLPWEAELKSYFTNPLK